MTAAAGEGARAALARVTVVTVTYESARALPGFLASLPAGLDLVVVDNASRDEGAALAAAHGAQVLCNPVNRGFGAGCNIGLAAVRTEFALLANPDARLSAQAVEALVAAADLFPDATLFGPCILDEAGRRVRSWDAEQSRRRLLPRRRDAEPWPEGPLCAEFLSGACLLVRVSAGLRFDERFFLYYEDEDMCLRLLQAGKPVIVQPAVRVAHSNRGSVRGPRPLRVEYGRGYHHARSKVLFTAKHQGPQAAAAHRLQSLTGALALLALRIVAPSPKHVSRLWGRIRGLWGAPTHY